MVHEAQLSHGNRATLRIIWKRARELSHLEAASRAVAADDADMRRVNAGADESIDVVVCEVFHHT